MAAPAASAQDASGGGVDDLEDIGGAVTGDGVRVTRDLPPVVRVHRTRARARGAGGGTIDAVDRAATTVAAAADDDDNACGGSASGNVVGASRTATGTITASDEAAAKGSNVPGTARVHVKTFGCSHNISDSEFMAGQLSSYGYTVSDTAEDADVWVVNTCTAGTFDSTFTIFLGAQLGVQYS